MQTASMQFGRIGYFRRRLALATLVAMLGPKLAGAAPTSEAAQAAVDFFERRIRPVLAERCYQCHSSQAEAPKAELELDTAEGLRRGGASGPAIVPGHPRESLLLSALRYESYEMPPDGKLPRQVIADFEQWIAAGAIDPRTDPADAAKDAREAVVQTPSSTEPEVHWAFRRPQKPQPPAIDDQLSPLSEIDAFIEARLADAGLSRSRPADPRTLLRRLHFDLVGLPPSADQLDAFAAAADDEGYERVVDQLLASPQFGERWGRYWLDVARYADTKGYVFEEDRNYPHAYKYRDWVIAAFNADMAFDRFIVAQLAADQLDDPGLAPAMGFLTLGRRFLNNPHDINDDRIDLITRGLMGLTVACARCHDHKYDPIPTVDYYSLYGVLASSREAPCDEAPSKLVDAEQPVDAVVFLRGNPGAPGTTAPRRFLTALTVGEPRPFTHGSGRMELAEAIANRDNPLTARVWVNRVWARLFGRGLVATQSDFGARGEPPTHPELLDWLACTLMDDGWSTKRLIRRIVTSQAYRRSSAHCAESAAVDPDNLLLWRMNRRRLDLESFRDSLLAAAGRLDLSIGGKPVQLTEPPFPTRRAVYGFIERQNLPAFFRTFDFANPNAHSASRPQTASPQQALFMMNSPLALEQARALTQRCAADSAPQRIRLLYRYALCRDPKPLEVAEAQDYVADGSEECWNQLAQVLLMSNEFVFID